jgi:putative molybdopterin biosynthesis protein
VRIVNREPGSGSRALLDAQLEKAGIETSQIQGYNIPAQVHLPAAWQVHSGAVECCIATRAAARVFGLHFIMLAVERYDFAVCKQSLEIRRIQNLFDIFHRTAFRRELEGLSGLRHERGRRPAALDYCAPSGVRANNPGKPS